ncbi:MAG: toxin-antitoxin system protein [Pseudomonadota bacterium]
MKSTTVRINPKAYVILQRLAKQSKEPMQSILAKAIELYRRETFLQKANLAFVDLRKNSNSWQEELKERQEWDITLSDDLKDF